jgi:hypothetical protein
MERNKQRALSLAGLVWLAFSMSIAAAQTVAVEGTVRDSTGAVMPNAVVELYQNDDMRSQAHTGEEGKLHFSAPPGTSGIIR